ncbi:MAG: ABC transporter ATP-binding protein [Candidatus Abyssobacteria bacterium SURF_5]|uniref:ABC transporter ATP-binding protein n=1 Tax=Abyssobacteria bacterium (strain SURF_5) TaxID=2093360 RepID=A0A3A4NXP4_ABYX5|nr:MAG: ABC transporter ATP-binding protein [Candidatus Abyssubacteria bacterium SURF_5]
MRPSHIWNEAPLPEIKVAGLRFSYPDGRRALDGVSFEIGRGETVSLLGANGTGKSTLLLCLVGILRGDGGISIGGVEVNPETGASIRRRTGFVFQNPEHQLFTTSVLDDVVFGPLNLGLSKEQALARAEQVLSDLNLSHLRDRLPHHLSQGEKKKAALATALAMYPDILLLDEPTAGLDPRSSAHLTDMLFHLKEEGKTVLIATHDMHLAEQLSDRVIVLGENGKVAREGAPEPILMDQEFLALHNLIHVHRHAHDRTEHGHPHFHYHRKQEHPHP